ncbi:MAG TPA: winged helix-turn-helix domain-containing protein [Candidatus Thermoplasmatota archaeon]|nr:winged helix-turn-helix domain-containing protein [Candidatus Thermoplasmatota archaeon]
MPAGREFDIFQTTGGYVAVTSPVRRRILDLLKDGDGELADLVKATGKAKPTLSNIHMPELLQLGLVEELPHATDARRKLYRLRGRRIGSSDVPLDQLRGAVKHYVSLSPLAYSVPFPDVLAALAAGEVPEAGLRRQARELGTRAAALFTTSSVADALAAVAGFWDREGLAKPYRLDFEIGTVELGLLAGCPAGKDSETAVILAGLLEGILRSKLGKEVRVLAKVVRARRVVLEVRS